MSEIEAKNKIMVLGKWAARGNVDGAVYLRAACECTDQDHDMSIWIEWDKEVHGISLMFSKTMEHWDIYNYPKSPLNWCRTIIGRMNKAFKLVFGGWFEVESDFLMMYPEQIRDFIDTLEQSYEYVLKEKAE